MARYHQFGFIVNEAGEPIENAEITVYEAGSDVIANLYYDEFGTSNSVTTPGLSAGPQLSTLSNGYYEYWIGDIYEPYGYVNEQKFKLTWVRVGVASGMIDYINVFPLGPQAYPIALTDCVSPSIVKNKLISDYFACKWDTHVDSEVVEDGDFYSVHGLYFVNVDELDNIPNKIINNYLGWHWDKHRLSTVQDFNPSAGRPHNIEEVNPLDGDNTLRNKLVSNRDLYYIHSRITDLNVYINNADIVLQRQIDDILVLTDNSMSGLWTIYTDYWISGINNQYYYDIVHNFDLYYPLVYCWDIGTNKVIQPAEVFFVDQNTVRITIDNENYPNAPDKILAVRIANGGVHRYPPLP
jgi:hypothetical protein